MESQSLSPGSHMNTVWMRICEFKPDRKRTLSGPKQKSGQGKFQGHWVICLLCVFLWLWEYGGGMTSDPWGVKGLRKRGEGGALNQHKGANMYSSSLSTLCFSSLSMHPPILFTVPHCSGHIWILSHNHGCFACLYFMIYTFITYWFCSLGQQNRAHTHTETSWLHPHRYRRCNWVRKGIKKRLDEAVLEWHPFNLQQRTWFLCVWGGGGHRAQFSSSIQAFTFQMLIAMSSPSPPLHSSQSPAPCPGCIGRMDPPHPTHQKPFSPLFSVLFNIQPPPPHLRDSPLRLDLRITSTAFSGPSPLQAFKVCVKCGDEGSRRTGIKGWVGLGVLGRVEYTKVCMPHTMDEGCSR